MAALLEVENLAVSFYPAAGEVQAVRGVSFSLRQGEVLAIVGESGCGKSTISSILMGRSRGYGGSVTIGGAELCTIREESLMRHITYVSHRSYLFKGTVRENLLMGCPAADDAALWRALEQVKLAASRGWTPPSPKRAATSRAASASGSRWRGRCCMTAPSTSSTRQPQTSTSRAKTRSWRRSTPSQGGEP